MSWKKVPLRKRSFTTKVFDTLQIFRINGNFSFTRIGAIDYDADEINKILMKKQDQ